MNILGTTRLTLLESKTIRIRDGAFLKMPVPEL